MKRGLISFSGGETSAFMLYYLLKNKSEEYEFVILFANTGRENNQTLDFVKKCSEYFKCKIVWVEAVFNKGASVNKGNKHKEVCYETATRYQDWKSRRDTPYEEMVQLYGLGNISNRVSTRELKQRPIESYLRSIGWNKGSYTTFIGIRIDEIDRMSINKKKLKIEYPLVNMIPFTKKHVNFFWANQPFRLLLKGYEGNCVTCYKKSLIKLAAIMHEAPDKFDFDKYLEWRYGYYIPERRIKELVRRLKPLPQLPIKIFRENTTVFDIEKISKFQKNISDDSKEYDIQLSLYQEESCEVFSQCGIDN